MITDRPDQTESAVIIPRDFVQFEIGFIYQKQKFSDGTNSFENENLILASTLCRYGVSSNFELRFGGEYFFGQSYTNGLKSDLQGVQNLMFGAKMQLRSNQKILSNIGVIVQTLIPFGNQKLRRDNFTPTFLLCVDQRITEVLSFDINLGTESVTHLGKYSYVYTGSLGYDLGNRL